MKTQPFHIEVIRERREEIGECLYRRAEWSSSVRHVESETASLRINFSTVRDREGRGGDRFFFYQGKRRRTGTEELMAKTIRVREKIFFLHMTFIAHDPFICTVK